MTDMDDDLRHLRLVLLTAMRAGCIRLDLDRLEADDGYVVEQMGRLRKLEETAASVRNGGIEKAQLRRMMSEARVGNEKSRSTAAAKAGDKG